MYGPKVFLLTKINDQRPDSRGKLNVLLQVNIDHEPTKSGVSPEGIDAVVVQIKSCHLVVWQF
jgi:uncharacterized pyridoxal phosphate-containing UPF0001 family protein